MSERTAWSLNFKLKANDQTVLFLGDNNMLYYPNAKMTIGACRACFLLKGLTAGDQPHQANIRLNFGDEETTGIVSMENGKLKIENEAGAWYDLSGRRLSGKPTTKGVYIHHGKKKVVK